MYYVYILRSELDKKFYIGFTKNLRERIKQHKSGTTKSTKYRKDLKLVYYEAYLLEEDARKQELLYKTGQGRRILKKRLENLLKSGEVA